ncbi:MAG: lipopolysaccharide assembly protein LapB, partial [Burkholderiales bacterium]
DYAEAALASGQVMDARTRLREFYARHPSTDVLNALLRLEADPDECRRLLKAHLQQHPSLEAGLGLLRLLGTQAPEAGEAAAVQASMATAVRPLQRYRCAACGFEAQHYFWQCPGCHGWDTYPPRRLQDQ